MSDLERDRAAHMSDARRCIQSGMQVTYTTVRGLLRALDQEHAERDALLAKFEALAGRLAAYDCVDAPDDVPLHVDVPDDYEAGIHAAAHDLSNLIREARA